MFEYTLSKRFFAVCLLLVLAVSCTLTALADAEPSGESPAPESSAAPDASPQPEETPSPSAEPGPSESPAPAETPEPTETPPPSETPAPIETPPPSETPTPTNTPAPTATPAPTQTPPLDDEPEPEYTIDGALDFLAENGVSLMAASAPAVDVGTDVIVPNFPGMHRVYLGRYASNSPASVDVSKLLPDLYSRLVTFNFSFEPVSFDVVSGSISGTSKSAFSYDPVSGVLSCPLLYNFLGSNYGYITYDLFCYYNDSVVDNIASGPTSFVSTNYSAGFSFDFPNFPGLHRKYVKSISGVNGGSLDISSYFPDLYSLFTSDNFSFMPNNVSSTNSSTAYSPLSVMPSFGYDSASGLFSYPKSYNYLGSDVYGGKTRYHKIYSNCAVWVFYNEVSEMVLPEPTPTPDPTPSPTPAPGDTPVSAPHPFWTTPFSDYSVTEGMLLLLFSLLSLFAVTKVFRR